MVCLATGSIVEPLDTHPKIEGLGRRRRAGMADVLVGMDKSAFTSYFLEQSANAAVSRDGLPIPSALKELIRTNSRKLAVRSSCTGFKEKVDAAEAPSCFDEPPEVEGGMHSRLHASFWIVSPRGVGPRKQPILCAPLSGMSGRVMVATG